MPRPGVLVGLPARLDGPLAAVILPPSLCEPLPRDDSGALRAWGRTELGGDLAGGLL